MIVKFRSSLWAFIVCLLLLSCGATMVWASPEDAALCKKDAQDGYSSAIKTCTRQIDSDPTDLESVFWRGVAYYKTGSIADNKYYALALVDFNRYTDAFPSDMQALENAVQCLIGLKRYDDAVSLASNIIDIDKNSLSAYMTRGMAYMWLSRYEDGVKDYTTAISLKPENDNTKFDAYFWRGRSNKHLKKYELAISDYKIALAIKPFQYHIHGYIAECLTNIGRKRDAIEAWQDFIAFIDRDSSKSKDPYYLREKAEARTEIEKLKK